MSMSLWVWLLIALYCAVGVHFLVALLTMKPIAMLTEESAPPPQPRPLWLKALILPVASVGVVTLWPILVWYELRR